MTERKREVIKWGLMLVAAFLLYKFLDKHSLIAVIQRNLPGKEAGLLAGMLLGEKSLFERGFYESLINSGLVHLVVASGSNVMLLSRFLIESLAWLLGRKKTILLTIWALWRYAAVVGWEAPILRAAIMMSVYYLAQLVGRRFDVFRALVAAAVVMVLVKSDIWGELGFWLSVTAFLGVTTAGDSDGQPLKNSLASSSWVAGWTLPVLALSVGKFSLVGPLTNLMAIIVGQWIYLVGAAGVAAGAVMGEAGKLLWLVLPALKYITWVAEKMGGASFAVVEVRFNWLVATGWYLVLIYIVIKRKRLID